MPAEVYDTPERQRLRVVVDQLRGASSSTVLDGLHALALVADKTPGSEGDAALLYALVCAEADRTKSKWASIVTRSEKRIAQIDRSPVTDETARFAAAWMAMVRISRSELDRHLRQD
jgi:acetyl-CoA acetyltransferase